MSASRIVLLVDYVLFIMAFEVADKAMTVLWVDNVVLLAVDEDCGNAGLD